MKMWSVRVIILLLFCYACLSSRNGGVRFVSKNFINTLQWEPAQPASAGEHLAYSVEYMIYDHNITFQTKAECQNISALTCDLTTETPPDYNVFYLAQVLVNGRDHGRTERFKPIAHTHLGPPVLSMYTTASSFHVNVSLPLGPKGVSVGDIIKRSGNTAYKTEIIYTLQITQPAWAAVEYENTTGRFVISFRMKATKYCGFVVYRPSSVMGRARSDNASFCVSVQGDPLTLLPWLLISAVSLGAIVVTAFLCMCSYVKGGKGVVEPQTLIVTSGAVSRVLPPQDKSLNISRMDVVPVTEKTRYATIQVKQHVPSVVEGGYSPQDIPSQAWQDGTGSSVEAERPASNSRNTSDQSSVVYSSVAVHVPNQDQEEDVPRTAIKDTNKPPLFSRRDRWTNGGMSPKLSSHEAPQLTVPVTFDSNPTDSTPLLLHAVRNSSGKLELPALTFQLLGNTEDWQGKPLLSDLINCNTDGPSLASVLSPDGSEESDSGCDDSTLNSPMQPYCNGHYCPSGPVIPDFQQGRLITSSSDDVLESGYKQNWMPANFLQSEHSCEYTAGTNYPHTWSGLKKDEEDEEDEALAGEELCSPSEILLGDWMVQIHE